MQLVCKCVKKATCVIYVTLCQAAFVFVILDASDVEKRDLSFPENFALVSIKLKSVKFMHLKFFTLLVSCLLPGIPQCIVK